MVTFPSVVQDLLSKGIVHKILVRVFASSRNIFPIRSDVEAIMRPKTVIKSEILRVIIVIIDNCSRTILYIVSKIRLPFRCSKQNSNPVLFG